MNVEWKTLQYQSFQKRELIDDDGKILLVKIYGLSDLDKEYLKMCKDKLSVVYVDGKYYRIIDIVDGDNAFEISMIEIDNDVGIVSDDVLDTNSFVASGSEVPVVFGYSDYGVISNVNYDTLGNIRMFKTKSVIIVTPKPNPILKIYDDVNSTDETQWILVPNPDEYSFTGNKVIEYGRYRVINGKLYFNDGNSWVDSGYKLSAKNSLDNGNIDLLTGNFVIKDFDVSSVKILYPLSWSGVYLDFDLVFNGIGLWIEGNNISIGTFGITDLTSVGYIVVNSDFIVKTSGLESDYTLDSGSGGWIFYYDINGYPLVEYSLSSNIGLGNGLFRSVVLDKYKGILFNEAENGKVNGGSVVADSGASNGNVVQGDGATLNVDIFDVGDVPSGWSIPEGNYKVIFRVKASGTSTNDSIKFEIYNNTTSASITSVTKTGGDIGTSFTYVSLDLLNYNGSDDIVIRVVPGANTDGTLFSVDYAILIPIGEISNIQKMIYVRNNQKLIEL